MKRTHFVLIILSACMHLAGCNDEPSPTPTPPGAGTGRTILVYQVANNNLGQPSTQYDALDIEEMIDGVKAGARGEDDRLLVYNAGYRRDPVLMEVLPDGLDTLKTYTADMPSVDSRRMLEVFSDIERLAPNEKRGLILWSHGSGWVQDGMSDINDDSRKRSFGSDNGRTMNVTTLANTIKKGPDFDWIYFDCCFMMSAETLYQLRDCTPYIIGSATELLVYGQPYHLTLPHLFDDDIPASLLAAANETFELYDKQYYGSNRTCTMSVVRTDGLDPLAAATADIYAASETPFPYDYRPQRFELPEVSSCRYFDLRHYAAALCVDDAGTERFRGSAALFDKFDKALNDCVLYRQATPYLWNDVALEAHCGISTYILRNSASVSYRGYSSLEWYENVASRLNLE